MHNKLSVYFLLSLLDVFILVVFSFPAFNTYHGGLITTQGNGELHHIPYLVILPTFTVINYIEIDRDCSENHTPQKYNEK